VSEGAEKTHEHRPLRGYSVLTGTFLAAFGGSLLAARRAGHELPERYSPLDIATVGVATHKLSRRITKDKVTGALRSPFTEDPEPAGRGEVEEKPRGTGLQRAIGELLVCPYCVGNWVAAAFGVGLVTAPRFTRLVAFIYTTQATSDFLQLAYLGAERRAAGAAG
jgi:hypothetical protein